MEFLFEGKKVHYETYGDHGKPVVLLNGIMMSTLSWKPFIEDFSDHNRLVLVDFFDQGQSARIPEGGYTHDIQVRLVEALLNHLNIEKAGIVGISYGGQVALEFGCRFPERTDKMVLFNTSAHTRQWLDDIGQAWIDAGHSGNGRLYYNVAIPVIYSPTFYVSHLDWMKNREKTLIPVFEDPEFTSRIERLTISSSSYDVRHLLKDCKIKSLIITGEEDFLLPEQDQMVMVNGLPNSFHVKLPLVGHCTMFEKPILFTTLALGFINSVTDEYKI